MYRQARLFHNVVLGLCMHAHAAAGFFHVYRIEYCLAKFDNYIRVLCAR